MTVAVLHVTHTYTTMARTVAMFAVLSHLTPQRALVYVQGKSCQLNLQKDLATKNEPLVLTVKKGKPTGIAQPVVVKGEGVVVVNPGEALMVACPGEKNVQSTSKSQTARLRCQGGLRFQGTNKIATAKSTGCTEDVASTLKITKTSCGAKGYTGVILQLGFELADGSWFPLVEVCHDVEDGVTWYSTHTLHGGSREGAVQSSRRKPFARGSSQLFAGLNIDKLYRQESQEAAFKKILGSSAGKKFVKKSSFSRGHLAPDGDFIFHSGQLLTYYFVNAAPQCQAFNQRNWLAVENTVRKLAIEYNTDLKIWTGTYGLLKVANNDGRKQPLYLEPTKKRIPVPEVFWKVVFHPRRRACTVVVGLNTVTPERTPSPLCDPSHPRGWPDLRQKDKGFTYYCDLDSFRKSVPYVPLATCRALLHFP